MALLRDLASRWSADTLYVLSIDEVAVQQLHSIVKPVLYNPDALSEAIDEYVHAYSQPTVLRAGFEYYKALLYQDGKDNCAAFTEKLSMPLLGVAVVGKNAGLPDTLRQVAADVRPLIVDRSGHFIQEERPVYLA